MPARPIVLSLLILAVNLPRAFAQQGTATSEAKPAVPPTELQFELLTDGKGNNALDAQRWGQTFQKLGLSLRIRRAILDDKPEISEKTLGRIRVVKVVGELDAKGRIIFPDRFFAKDDTDKLSEWIRELQTYGAKGSPEGKPAFGLDQAEFAAIFTALSETLDDETHDLPLTAAITRLQLPQKYPLRFTTAAAAELKKQEPPRVLRSQLNGFTKGTALAAVLNEFGLGYKPLRTPNGTIELAVDALSNSDDRWPAGWPMPDEASRLKTTPKLFQLVPVDIRDVPLQDVLDAVSVAAEIPILVDHHRIEGAGIDVATLKVSHPSRKTSWSLLLRGVTTPYKLTRKLMIDEKGRPFVWITTLEVGVRSQ